MKTEHCRQTELFVANNDPECSFERLDLPDGDVSLYRNVFTGPKHDDLLRTLLTATPWQQHRITIPGRSLAAPRLSAWYGDPEAVYSYSGLELQPLAWTPTLWKIKTVADAIAKTRFNSVLLNLYRDGRDSVGWHSDAEPELGPNPVIASVSLGATRRFVLRHQRKPLRIELALEGGSVLVMAGTTQHYWRHQLPKTRQPVGPRVNLTFRVIRETIPPGRKGPAE